MFTPTEIDYVAIGFADLRFLLAIDKQNINKWNSKVIKSYRLINFRQKNHHYQIYIQMQEYGQKFPKLNCFPAIWDFLAKKKRRMGVFNIKG